MLGCQIAFLTVAESLGPHLEPSGRPFEIGLDLSTNMQPAVKAEVKTNVASNEARDLKDCILFARVHIHGVDYYSNELPVV